MATESPEPRPPELSLESFRQLCTLAIEFHQLAPWDLLSDSDMLGIMDPVTGSLRLASVMGNAGQVYGLLIHRGEQGLRWALTTAFGDGSQNEDPNYIRGQDGLMVDFVSRRELKANDLALLKEIDFKPLRGPKRSLRWPQFRSFQPGTVPWPLSQAEANLLLADMRKTIEFVRLIEKHPNLPRSKACQVAMYPSDPHFQGPLHPKDIDWQKLVLATDPITAPIKFPKNERAALADLPIDQSLSLEVDCLYSPHLVAGEPRPYFPWLALVVDGTTGHLLGVELADSQKETPEEVVARCLWRALRKHQHRPREIAVCRQSMAVALAPLVNSIGFRLFKISCMFYTQMAYRAFRHHDPQAS